MSAKNLMDGMATYIDVEELASTAAVDAQAVPTTSLTTSVASVISVTVSVATYTIITAN